MNAAISEDFARTGYFIGGGIGHIVDRVKERFVTLLQMTFSPSVDLTDPAELNKFLIDTYDRNKPALMHVYSVLDRTPELYGAAFDPILTDALRLAGIQNPIVSSYPTWRLDVVNNDQKRWFPFHQDSYHERFSSTSVTVWFPLHDVAVDKPGSTLGVLPGAHKFGVLQLGKGKFDIVDERIKGFATHWLDLSRGQFVLFSNYLPHRSGVIKDPQGARLSVQLRYDDLLDPEYKSRGWPANFRIADAIDDDRYGADSPIG